MNVKNTQTTYESPLVFFEVVSTDEGFAQSGNFTVNDFEYDGDDLSC